MEAKGKSTSTLWLLHLVHSCHLQITYIPLHILGTQIELMNRSVTTYLSNLQRSTLMKVLQFLSVSLLHWIPSYNVLTNKLHIYYTTMHCTLIGAIHRYYESRRRIFNDSQPERQSAADAAKKRAKRKQLRQNVSLQLTFTSCIICNIKF